MTDGAKEVERWLIVICISLLCGGVYMYERLRDPGPPPPIRVYVYFEPMITWQSNGYWFGGWDCTDEIAAVMAAQEKVLNCPPVWIVKTK